MMDIKVKRAAQVLKSNETVEKVDKLEVVETQTTTINKTVKRQYSLVSLISFVFMFVSISSYIFLISSSVFYAVKQSQYSYKIEKISSATSISTSEDDKVLNKNFRERISYINLDSDTSISLK